MRAAYRETNVVGTEVGETAVSKPSATEAPDPRQSLFGGVCPVWFLSCFGPVFPQYDVLECVSCDIGNT